MMLVATSIHCFRCGCSRSKARECHDNAACSCVECAENSGCIYCNIDECYVCGEKKQLEQNDDKFYFVCSPSCSQEHSVVTKPRHALWKSVNVQSSPLNRTILHSAVLAGDCELTWTILLHGANPFLRDILGLSPIDLATSLTVSSPRVSKGMGGALPSPHEAIVRMLPKSSVSCTLLANVPPPPSLVCSQSAGVPSEVFASAPPLLGGQPDTLFPSPPARTDDQRASTIFRGVPSNGTSTALEVDRMGSGRGRGVGEPGAQESARGIPDSYESLMAQVVHQGDEESQTASVLLSIPLQCAGCLDHLTSPGQVAYHCTHAQCEACLCGPCLYASVLAVIKDALYAVPPVLCPGTCRHRIPSYVWGSALRGVPLQDADHLQHFKATQKNLHYLQSQLADIHDMFINDLGETDLEAATRLMWDYLHLLVQIAGAVDCPFVDRLYDVALCCGQIEDFACSASVLGTCANRKYNSFVAFSTEAHAIASTQNGIGEGSSVGQWGRSRLDYYRWLLMGCSFDEVLSATLGSVFYLGVLAVEWLHLSDDDRDCNSTYCPTYAIPDMFVEDSSALLLRKYQVNAAALLTVRCGECDATITLLRAAVTGASARRAALEMAAEEWPLEHRHMVLKLWLDYCAAAIPADAFVREVLAVVSSGSEFLPGEPLKDSHYRSFAVLFSLMLDVERQVTAQLALMRLFPCMDTPCCLTRFCFTCKTMYGHVGATCADMLRKEIGTACQHCPGCGVPTLRSEGCTSMYCVCGTLWEWMED